MPRRTADYPIPVPGPGVDLDIHIPVELIKEFQIDPRLIIRYPWVIGYPPPELLRKLRPDLFEQLDKADLEVMIVPKQMLR